MLGRPLSRWADGDKPAMHRGPKGGDKLLTHCVSVCRAHPCWRTPSTAITGCLVLGRHLALALLGKLFKQGKVGKCYSPKASEADEGRIFLVNATRRAADEGDSLASSTWKVMAADKAQVALEPLIVARINCESIAAENGWQTISTAARHGRSGRILHSRDVTVPISKNKPPVKVTAPVPDRCAALPRAGAGGVLLLIPAQAGLQRDKYCGQCDHWFRFHGDKRLNWQLSIKHRLDFLGRLTIVNLCRPTFPG